MEHRLMRLFEVVDHFEAAPYGQVLRVASKDPCLPSISSKKRKKFFENRTTGNERIDEGLRHIRAEPTREEVVDGFVFAVPFWRLGEVT